MNRNRRIQIAAVMAILALAGGLVTLRASKQEDYTTAVVTRGDIESTIAATGSCNAVVTVQVGSQVSGNIKTLFADFNTQVKKDQLVALIDPELFQARVGQAQANVDSAKASVVNAEAMAQKARADAESARAELVNLEAEVAKARVAVRDAKIKLDRRREMLRDGLIAQEDNDSAEATYDSAVAAEHAAEAQQSASASNVKSAESQIQVLLAQIQSAKGQVNQTEAALSQAELDLKHTRIVAPVDGTVISRQVDAGQTVAASLQAPTVFQIAQDLTKMQVDTNVDEADIGKVRVGQRAFFTVDAYAGTNFPATVTQIREAPINTQNVITYDVVLGVDNTDLKLFPGMTANVRILTSSSKNVLEVPSAALRFQLPGDPASGGAGRTTGKTQSSRLFVLGPDGRPTSRKVVTGLSNGTFTEVKDGVQEGDRVVVARADHTKRSSTTAVAARPRGPAF